MRLIAVCLLCAACNTPSILAPGAYLTEPNQDSLGIEGINLDLERSTVRFVFDDRAEDRSVEFPESADWRVGCPELSRKGVREETVTVTGDSLAVQDGALQALWISAYCGEEGVVRLGDESIAEWELHLRRF